jgi:mevalonate kinase
VTEACAPGKIILVGEHAVVYGRPAVAVPVHQVQAHATVEAGDAGQGIVVVASDLGRTAVIGQGEVDSEMVPLEAVVLGVVRHLGLGLDHDLTITVDSSIPIARGLGSGAAVSTAMARALALHFSVELSPEEVSQLVYEVERFHHGTPSGIDNTVIAYEHPVYFVRGRVLETFQVGRSLHLVIGDSGVASSTKEVVESVRKAWKRSRDLYEDLFDSVGNIGRAARRAMEMGDAESLGRRMDENHQLLQDMGVSSPQLDALVEAARKGGALGAKLSGAGRGGNVIALVTAETRDAVERALMSKGAHRVIWTEIPATKGQDTAPRRASSIAPQRTGR